MINYKSLLIFNIFAVIFTVGSIAFMHYASDTIKNEEIQFDYKSEIKKLDEINDIDFIREAMKLAYKNSSESNLDIAKTYKSFASFTTTFAVIFFVNILILYVSHKRQISNK